MPELEAISDKSPAKFDIFDDVLKLYSDGIKVIQSPLVEKYTEELLFETLKELIRAAVDEGITTLTISHIIRGITQIFLAFTFLSFNNVHL